MELVDNRGDIPQGDQLAHSLHSAMEFAHKHPNQFNDWMRDSQYLVSLSVDDEQKLKEIYNKLEWFGANYTILEC